MAPNDEVQVGDLVNVPGGMHGTVRYLGSVAGKQGRFAGVELASEYSGKGKNNGAVDGRQYFTASAPSSGIFVPMNGKYVTKRAAPATQTPAKPTVANFSKSVGPGTAPPSTARPKFRRPSLPRPESPRTTTSPPKLNLAGSRTPSSLTKPPTPSNGSSTPRTPIRGLRTPTSRPPSSIGVDENTPTAVRRSDRSDAVSTPAPDDSETAERIKVLEQQLKDRDKQLEEQANTLNELQQSITELEGTDGLQVRAQLREKNEKIASLTAEFDSHRADFRSTLDTLEVAATETERVYEKRIEELLQSNRELQDRGEDVEAVATQLKQLEELVSELEEGLEDARRGEAEARGEVEFLRGEVERAKLELKQEKEKSAATAKEAGGSSDGGGRRSTSSKDINQKDDEIQGLKAIIHSLSRGDPSNQALMQQNGMASGSNNEEKKQVSQMEYRMQELESLAERKDHRIEELENQLREAQEDTGGRGSTASGGNATTSPLNIRKHQQPERSGQAAHSHTLSDRTVVPPDWNDNQTGSSKPPMPQLSPSNSRRQLDHHTGRALPTMQESDSHSSSTDDGGALWCEICETSGHDILTCTNMFGSGAANPSAKAAPQNSERTGTVAASSAGGSGGTAGHNNESGSRNTNGLKSAASPGSQRTGKDAVLEGLKGIGRRLSTSMSPVAGKASGVIDETKWCALCERDGHESIDCPFDE